MEASFGFRDVGIVFSIMLGAVSLMTTAWFVAFRIATMISQIGYHTAEITALRADFKQAWQFQMEGGELSLIRRGVAQRNSPIEVDEKTLTQMSGYADNLKEFYRTTGAKMNANELRFAIYENFGQALIETLCIPLGLNLSECIVIACAVAKGVAKGHPVEDVV